MSRFTDRDLGRKAAFSRAARFARRLRVGVFDPEIARYGVIHEMRTRFMRDTFDQRQGVVDQQLDRMHEAVVSGGDVAAAQLEIAEGYAQAYREAIGDEGLVDTGALRGSIEVREGGE